MPRWHIKPPYPHDTHRGALWCCSTLAFFTYGTKCILHSCGLTDSGSYYAEIWKQLFVLGSWFWSWCAALQPNPDISLHSIPLWKQLSAAQWLHPPLPRAEAAHSVSQAHISHSEMNWLFSSVCRTPHVQARPWNNVFSQKLTIVISWLLTSSALEISVPAPECDGVMAQGQKHISARKTRSCPACQNVSHISKSLSNVYCDCCMSSVLPASGFGTGEQSQEAQKTMKGNWSATLNELSFKEAFIHPQRIGPAESDWLVLSVN